jgi:putative salt-induced outer membrane protein
VDGLISITSGNTDNRKATINADTRLRLGEHRQYAKLTIRRDEQNGVSTKKQNLFRYEYNWIFSKPWYLGLTGDYERDPIRALSHRATLGAVLGRDLFNYEKGFLTIKFGAGYSAEKLDEMDESGVVGLWELFFEHDLGRADVFHDHNINYQNYGNNNMIFKSNTGFKIDIFKTLYAKLSYSYDYESEPAAGKSNDDSTLAVGLGAKF